MSVLTASKFEKVTTQDPSFALPSFLALPLLTLLRGRYSCLGQSDLPIPVTQTLFRCKGRGVVPPTNGLERLFFCLNLNIFFYRNYRQNIFKKRLNLGCSFSNEHIRIYFDEPCNILDKVMEHLIPLLNLLFLYVL